MKSLIGNRELSDFIMDPRRIYAMSSLCAIGFISLIFLPRWYLSLLRAKKYYHKMKKAIQRKDGKES